MDTSSMRTTIERIKDLFNTPSQHQNSLRSSVMDAFRESYAEDVQFHDAGLEPTRGLEALKQRIDELRVVFPDLVYEIGDPITADDQIGFQWTARGTHVGSFLGHEPTKKRVEIKGLSICRFSNGKVVEVRQIWDKDGLLEQLAIGDSR